MLTSCFRLSFCGLDEAKNYIWSLTEFCTQQMTSRQVHYISGASMTDPKDVVLKWAIPGLFFVYFRSFQANKQYSFSTNQCEKMSIQYPVLGFEPATMDPKEPHLSIRNYDLNAPIVAKLKGFRCRLLSLLKTASQKFQKLGGGLLSALI